MAQAALLSMLGGELKNGLRQAVQPLIDNANELKSAGLSTLVRSVSIAAEPVLDVLEMVSEEIAPVFQPLFDILADAIMDELPNIQLAVEEMKPLFDEIAADIPALVQQLPKIVETFIKFTGFSWQTIIAFLETYGEDLVNSGVTIANWLIQMTPILQELMEFMKAFFSNPNPVNWIINMYNQAKGGGNI